MATKSRKPIDYTDYQRLNQAVNEYVELTCPDDDERASMTQDEAERRDAKARAWAVHIAEMLITSDLLPTIRERAAR